MPITLFVSTHTERMVMHPPLLYKLKIVPDMFNWTFDGEIIIQYFFDDEIDEITLNASDLEIHQIQIPFDKNNNILKFELQNQLLILKLGKRYKGKFTIEIKYSGKITDGLVGVYKSKYEDHGKEYTAVLSQCFETEARKIFPCTDHPKFKAAIDFELVIDKELDAISNESILEIKHLNNNKKLVNFYRTPIMSTYLFFFAVAKLEYIEDNSTDIPIKIITTPNLASKYGNFSLDYAVKSYKFCQNFFSLQYPLSKLDLIGLKNFVFGGMENFGAIALREDLLLKFPTSSQGDIYRIKQIISHEISHQWFGDIVSPIDWKYLWLNESFATYFAYLTIEELDANKQYWEEFIRIESKIALNSDGLLNTVPIELSGEERQALNIKSAPIIYNKGASILRQLATYLGKKNFKKGIQFYLNQFQYSVASGKDLWDSFNTISDESITDFMENWTLIPGYPLITIKRGTNELKISQQKFTYLPTESEQLWIIPLSIKLFNGDDTEEEKRFLMKEEEMIIKLSKKIITYKVNLDFAGFYRVSYTQNELNKLGNLIINQELNPIDRWSIENDLFALLRSGKIKLKQYLILLDYYKVEDNRLVIRNILDNLFSLYLILEGETLEELIQSGGNLISHIIYRIGLHRADNEDPNFELIRGDILYIASMFNIDEAINFGKDQFELLKNGKTISNELRESVLRIAANSLNNIDWFLQAIDDAENEKDKLDYVSAICFLSDENHLDTVKDYLINKLPNRHLRDAIFSLVLNKKANQLWSWYQLNYEKFKDLHPVHYQSIISKLIPANYLILDQIKQDRQKITNEYPFLSDAFDLGIENAEINHNI